MAKFFMRFLDIIPTQNPWGVGMNHLAAQGLKWKHIIDRSENGVNMQYHYLWLYHGPPEPGYVLPLQTV